MEQCTPSAGFLQRRNDIQWLSMSLICAGSPPVAAFQEQSLFSPAEFPHPSQMLINTLMHPLLWYICLLSCGLTPFCNSFAPFNSFCSSSSPCPHAFSGLCALSIQDYTGCLEWHNCCHVLQGGRVISQSYILICFMNAEKSFKEFKGDVTELRWLEEVMMQTSIGKNEKATEIVKKWVMWREPCHSEWLSKGVSSVHGGEWSWTIMIIDNICLSVPVKDAAVNKTNSTLMSSPQKTIWQQS